MRIQPKEYQSTIVLAEHLNPLIFRPHWLAAHNLIGQDEALNAAIEVSHKEIMIFNLERVKITVDRDRFVVTGQREYRALTSCDPRLRRQDRK